MRIENQITWLCEKFDRRADEDWRKPGGVFVEIMRQAAHRPAIARRSNKSRLRVV
jgi:hypothetical protein